MNKYTLKFISLDLELKYQDSRSQSIKPFFQVLNGITLLMCVFKIILQFLYQDLTGITIFSGASLILLIAQICLMKCKPNWVDNYLLVLNHAAMLYQIYLEVGFEAQEAFVFGQNQMVMHLVTILVSDFVPAVIQILGNTGIKIAIALYFQPTFSYSTLIYTMIVCFAMLFTIQKINQQYRRSFLFTSSDNLYEQMIPILIDNPFVICNYDSKNISFRIKYSNLQDEFQKQKTANECLQHLIRNHNVYGQSLESFLISRKKMHHNLLINKMLVATDTKNNMMMIRYFEYEFTEFTSVLIIDLKEKMISSLQQKNQMMEKKIISFSMQLHKFIIRLTNLLSKPELHKKSIYQAKINLMHFLTKFEKHMQKAQPYKILQKMTQFISLYQMAYGDRVIFNQQLSINEIYTSPSLFNTFFTLLLTILFKIKSPYIELNLITNSEFEEQLDLLINIEKPSELYSILQKSTHFRKVLKQIGPYDYIQIDREKIIISIYKNMNEINLIRSFKFEVLND